MKRIYSFDYLRTLAIIGILLCHFFFNWYNTMGLGRFCGNTFNALFIAMSGLLLGMRHSENSDYVYGRKFLKKRFTKLSLAYYPFLVFVFIFLTFVAKSNVTIKDIVMHVAYLPWFDKLPGFEHLWFMTMISMCYLMVSLYSKVNKLIGKFIAGVCIVCFIVLGYLLEMRGLPGQMLLYLIVFLLCFYNVKRMMSWVMRKNTYLVIGVTLISIAYFGYLFYNGMYDLCRYGAELSGILCALLIFASTIKLFENASKNVCIEYISNISFELYLVHHVFAFADYSVVNIVPNPFLGFVCLLLLSITLASVLHGVSMMLAKTVR